MHTQRMPRDCIRRTSARLSSSAGVGRAIVDDAEPVAVLAGGALRLAGAITGFAEGHAIDRGQADADAEARHLGANAVGDGEQEAGAVLEAAAVLAAAVAGAQQLVPEVAVAVLDVDELEADRVGTPRRGNEILD
jgi:hypothetical protein